MDYYLSAIPYALKPAADRHWTPQTPAEEDAYYQRVTGPTLPAWVGSFVAYLKARHAAPKPASIPQHRHVLRHT